jgi:polyisoprenyl-teichoic acid--peptidoglycan teichoic acid transferase
MRARQKAMMRTLRAAVLGLFLGIVLLAVPDSERHSTELIVVKMNRADGVDLTPDVVWILGVGSDARPGDEMTRSRGDAIQLVGINANTGAATTIGVPRDSYVDVPGYGRNKINAGLYYGGPQLMGQAVGNMIGIQPDYVMVTRFPFFENMIDDIGGIEVDNPRYFSDPYLKKNGFEAGKIRLDGYGAMAFSRIRKSLAGGDFDRSANQQRTLRGIHAKIRSKAGQSGWIERGVLSVMEHTATDLPPADLFEIAHAIAQVKPGRITNCVVQGGVGYAGAASVVFPDLGMARRFGDLARDDATLESCA